MQLIPRNTIISASFPATGGRSIRHQLARFRAGAHDTAHATARNERDLEHRILVKTPDWISLLEASYDLGAPNMDAWLAGVLTQVIRLLERDVTIGMLVGSYTPSSLDIMGMASNGPPGVREWFDGVHRQAPPEFLNLVYKSSSALLSASRDTWPKFPGLRSEAERLSEGRIQDIISVAGHTGLGHVVTVAALCPKPTSVTALERFRWPRAAAHVAAGLRLYLSFERALESPRIEAVLDPSGNTRDAKPAAQSQRKRQVLREAVRRIDGARTSAGRKDVARSLQACKG